MVLLPFNVGVSAGRNALVDRTSRPYLLLLDDDRVFTEGTRIEALLDVLDADPSIGVAAGSSVDNGTDLISYEHNIRVKHRLIHYYPVGPATMPIGGHPCRLAQGVHNFALFRREVFASTRWDEELKSMEHTDFFLRLSETGWKVVHVGDVSVAHFHESPPGYDSFRYDRANNRARREEVEHHRVRVPHGEPPQRSTRSATHLRQVGARLPSGAQVTCCGRHHGFGPACRTAIANYRGRGA